MLQSTNDRDREQSFALKVEKTEDGGFKATSKSFPDISATGETFKSAVSKVNQELQSRHRTGKLKR